MTISENTNTKHITERPPVIVVMGHIDHGKSKLLDYIRSSHVVEGEAGGITQHISAYEVEHTTSEGMQKKISFLDTPGHEAFGGMRARGAKVADIAILVVAADDGVKAQTIEALNAIKSADIPYVVAINKIDKPDADRNKTIQSLIENEIYIEGYGGDIPHVFISAKDGTGIGDLLDTLLLVAELEELKGDTSLPASGVVIETHVDTQKGISATLIIKNGTLKKGMYIQAEKSCAPVRILEDFKGVSIEEASFSSPVQIHGFDSIPSVGASFCTHPDKKTALNMALACTIEDVENTHEALSVDAHTMPVILKSDVVGTAEAITSKLRALNSERTHIKIIHSSVGTITEGDVKKAGTSNNAYVIGFNVKIDPTAQELAERMGITIKTFTIIYELLEWFESRVQDETPKQEVEEQIAEVKILKVFNPEKNAQVVGGKVLSGYIAKNMECAIVRQNERVGTGTLVGLQQQRTEVETVQEGNEFGARIKSTETITPGDRLFVFRIIEK